MVKKKTQIDKMYEAMNMAGHKSNLRLTVKVLDGREVRFFYDKGIREIDDPQNLLSKLEFDGNGDPRFLEDIIEVFGKKNVSIHEAGKFEIHKKIYESLLKVY